MRDEKFLVILGVLFFLLIVVCEHANHEVNNNTKIIGKTFYTAPGRSMHIPFGFYEGVVGDSVAVIRLRELPLLFILPKGSDKMFYKVGSLINWGRYEVKLEAVDENGFLKYSVYSYWAGEDEGFIFEPPGTEGKQGK